MGERDLVVRLLGRDEPDTGCDGGFALLAEYVEGELLGRDVRALFPGVAAHLRDCPACADDYRGLVALVREGAAPLE